MNTVFKPYRRVLVDDPKSYTNCSFSEGCIGHIYKEKMCFKHYKLMDVDLDAIRCECGNCLDRIFGTLSFNCDECGKNYSGLKKK